MFGGGVLSLVDKAAHAEYDIQYVIHMHCAAYLTGGLPHKRLFQREGQCHFCAFHHKISHTCCLNWLMNSSFCRSDWCLSECNHGGKCGHGVSAECDEVKIKKRGWTVSGSATESPDRRVRRWSHTRRDLSWKKGERWCCEWFLGWLYAVVLSGFLVLCGC